MSTVLPEWAEPGVYEVAPGIHRIPLPLPGDGLRAVNVYAIVDGERVVLIDSGWALLESQEQLTRALDDIGYSLDAVEEFLVTHLHRDHYTQAVAIRRTYGTPIRLGSGERPTMEYLATDRGTRPPGQFAQLARAGAADLVTKLDALADDSGDEKTWELPDRWIEGSIRIPLRTRTLHAVPTPGHTQGHYVFRDADAGLLFAGDHVLPHITPSIGFEARSGRSPLGDYLDSLLLVRTMPDTRLLPAHGPVSDSVHTRVDELLDHHATRLDATLAVVVAGAQTAREAAERLGWTRHGRAFTDLDLLNQMLAVVETRAHLQVLVERNQLRCADVDGVTHYEAA